MRSSMLLKGAPVTRWVPGSIEEIPSYVLNGGGLAQGEPGGRLSEGRGRTIRDLVTGTLTGILQLSPGDPNLIYWEDSLNPFSSFKY